MKRFLKVSVSATEIKPIKEILGIDDYREEFKRKRSHEQIWKVSSFEEARAQIETHNKYIRDGIRHHDRPTTRSRTRAPQTFTSHAPVDEKLWDWKKVSKKVRDQLAKLYVEQAWGPIMKIHNDLKLTDEHYCCDGYKSKIIDNMEKAKKDGILEF